MSRFTLPTIAGGYLSMEALNSALRTIEEALDTLLSRVGTAPNQMEADLDMNGHSLLNVGASSDAESLVTQGTMESYVSSLSSGIMVQKQQSFTAIAAQTTFVLTQFSYSVGTYNLAVYVNGVRKFAGTDYEETNSTTIDFLAGMTGGELVTFVTNDFLATVDLTAHQHEWSAITGVPLYASRWPTYDEVTGKPATFAPAAHNQDAGTITTGRLADARRGIHVQATQPVASTVGELWFW